MSITFSIDSLMIMSSRRPDGYLEDVLSRGSVDGNIVTLSDEAFAKLVKKYRNAKDGTSEAAQPPTSGPGTELKALLKVIGITASPGCSCNTKARIMDEKGPDWCLENIEEVCDWLQAEATKRKLPFLRTAGKILIRKAVSNYRKKGQ